MYKEISQREVQPGMVLMVQGYEWVVDEARHVPADHPGDLGCFRFRCHWSGMGANPRFFNDDFTTGAREDLPVTIKF